MKHKKVITLPPHSDGSICQIDSTTRRIVVVGANGAGKSRFTARLATDLGERAFVLSALNGIFERSQPSEDSVNGIDQIYSESAIASLSTAETTQLERLMAMLMRDEMLNLIGYKLQLTENPDARLQATKLDEIIGLWQEIFPGNKILIERGRMLFSSHQGEANDSYSAGKLSAGERAVIYYLGAITYAPQDSVVMVDSPEMFLNPSIMQSVWNRIELLRPDCTFVYTTHDLDFAASRSDATTVWVRSCDATAATWDYAILSPDTAISDEIYAAILGARKPVLFIEGDSKHSIDSKLYSLIFKEFTVKPLGSCNKVIEATRAFNSLNSFHQMDSYGIVDRDRRDEKEVEYLRGKRILVPNVAEVENILMLEGVIRAVAHHCNKDEDRVFGKVKRSIIRQFASDISAQAMLHTRHRVKRTMEYRIDGRFASVEMLEDHMQQLFREINPRGIYDNFLRRFTNYKNDGNYDGILMVYNQKTMLPASNVAGLCGLQNKEEYINTILYILRHGTSDARRISDAIRSCFNLNEPLIAQENESK